MQPREPRRKRERFVPEIGPAGSAHLTCLGRAKKHLSAIPAVKGSRSHLSTPHPYPAVGPQELEAEVERERLRGSGRRPSFHQVRKFGFNSAAPPVISTVSTSGVFWSSAMTRSAVRS